MKIKKRVALYMTDNMHQELRNQAAKLGLDMGSYVVHLLMREKDRSKNETIFKDLLQTTKTALNDPEILVQMIRQK